MKKKNIINGRKIVNPTASAPYCRRIASTKEFGRYLTARIETVIDIIHCIGLFFSPPNRVFCFITVNVINKINMNNIIFAKRNSSKLFMSSIASPEN